jgi:hypothetical protein
VIVKSSLFKKGGVSLSIRIGFGRWIDDRRPACMDAIKRLYPDFYAMMSVKPRRSDIIRVAVKHLEKHIDQVPTSFWMEVAAEYQNIQHDSATTVTRDDNLANSFYVIQNAIQQKIDSTQGLRKTLYDAGLIRYKGYVPMDKLIVAAIMYLLRS